MVTDVIGGYALFPFWFGSGEGAAVPGIVLNVRRI